jgi:hypothetical protein
MSAENVNARWAYHLVVELGYHDLGFILGLEDQLGDDGGTRRDNATGAETLRFVGSKDGPYIGCIGARSKVLGDNHRHSHAPNIESGRVNTSNSPIRSVEG